VSTSATTDVDDGADSLWMVTRPRVGDVIVKWCDLTDAEMARAIAHHNTPYPTTEPA
jgi:hypothetical protein